ncbi:MAG: HAD-IA family hydrolase [Pseudomonadota bacterium]
MSKCLLFDCDGTLVDSELLNCEAMSIELGEAGIDEPPAALFERYKGGNFYRVLEDLEQIHNTPLGPDFTQRFRDRAHQHFTDNLRAVDGIKTVLESLPGHRCVVSNAPLKKIVHELTVTGLLGFFADRLHSAYDIGHWKPEPHLLLRAAEHEGFAVADCVVIEDSQPGVQAALNAGMPVILYDEYGLDTSAQATCTINSMHDLPDALAQL